VLTTPVVRCLKQQLPNVEIHFATKNKFESLVKNNPNIDKIHLLNDSLFEFVHQLKSEKFDVIIDLHNNLRTLIIKTLLPCKSYSFSKLNFEKWMVVNFKINRLPNVHIVDRYLATTQALKIVNDNAGLDFFLTQADENFGADFYKCSQPYFAFAIGGQFATKKMPPQKIVSLVQSIQNKVVLLGGKEDESVAKFITENTNNAESLCGKISLTQSAAIVKYATAVITHDTGLMHIAAAFQKKIYVIWGNTIPQFGMYPYLKNKNNEVRIEVENLNCRPCSKIGFSACPKQHFNCMNLVQFPTIAID
jgi:ADP-heptose:LPS heptosyltransferase